MLKIKNINVGLEEIQKAYRKIALKCHPDRTTNLPEKERAVLEKNSKKLQTLMNN